MNKTDFLDAVQPRVLLNSTGISILTLRNISVSEAGYYVCSSKDLDNSVKYQVRCQYPIPSEDEINKWKCISQNVTVDVMVPPSFIKKPSNQVCPNGRTTRFECQAQGIPTPRIYWLKDAENVTINGTQNSQFWDKIWTIVAWFQDVGQCTRKNRIRWSWRYPQRFHQTPGFTSAWRWTQPGKFGPLVGFKSTLRETVRLRQLPSSATLCLPLEFLYRGTHQSFNHIPVLLHIPSITALLVSLRWIVSSVFGHVLKSWFLHELEFLWRILRILFLSCKYLACNKRIIT